jgi:hypothetical protein
LLDIGLVRVPDLTRGLSSPFPKHVTDVGLQHGLTRYKIGERTREILK